MADKTTLGLLGRGLLVVALAGVSLTLPVHVERSPAVLSPSAAAQRAEAIVPAIGLPWGKLRGWHREVNGWRIVWQPAHGFWLVSAWVPEDTEGLRYRLDAAPWLPGARLSQGAARAVAGDAQETGVARDRLARRDWTFGSRRVLGALWAGEALPRPSDGATEAWLPALVGLLLAGAVARLLLPAFPDPSWRRATVVSAAVWVALAPWCSALAGRAFESGVRPWITELAFVAVALLAAGTVTVLVVRFPPTQGRPASWWLVPCSLAVGVMAGRLRPASWLPDVAGLPLSLVVLITLAIVGGWLVAMAGDGLRELLAIRPWARSSFLAVLAGAAVIGAGTWLGPVVSCVLVAARGRGEGSWVATAFAWGWIAGGAWASCWWPAAQATSLAMLLLGWAGAAVGALVEPSGARSRQSG